MTWIGALIGERDGLIPSGMVIDREQLMQHGTSITSGRWTQMQLPRDEC